MITSLWNLDINCNLGRAVVIPDLIMDARVIGRPALSYGGSLAQLERLKNSIISSYDTPPLINI